MNVSMGEQYNIPVECINGYLYVHVALLCIALTRGPRAFCLLKYIYIYICFSGGKSLCLWEH